jgi:hypothetical protein
MPVASQGVLPKGVQTETTTLLGCALTCCLKLPAQLLADESSPAVNPAGPPVLRCV